jgi:hypothetical protein
MALTDSEEAMVQAAVKARRDASKLSRRLERDKFLARQQWARAVQGDREYLGRRLLALAGLDYGELKRNQERNAEGVRAFLEQEQRATRDDSVAIAQQQQQFIRQRIEGLSRWSQMRFPDSPPPMSPVILDTATHILPPEGFEYGGNSYDHDPIAKEHNFVRAYVEMRTEGPGWFKFEIPPGHSPLEVEFVFTWTADRDAAINAVSFVQPYGWYALSSYWTFAKDSYANVNFTAGLDLYLQSPNVPGITTSHGTRENPVSIHEETSAWEIWDSKIDFGSCTDVLLLTDTNFLNVVAGTFVVFIVWVALDAWGFGDSLSTLNFKQDPNDPYPYGINVPVVVVPRFPLA